MMPFSGNISRGYAGIRSADGILNSIGSITRKLTAERTITGSSGLFTGSITAVVARLIAGLLTMAGVVTRKIIAARSTTGITDQTGSIDRKLSAERKVVGSQAAFSGNVFKGFFRSVIGVCGTIQATLTKKMALKKLINGDITLTGVIVRKLTASRHVQGVSDWAGAIARKLTAKRFIEGTPGVFAGAIDIYSKVVVAIFGSLGQLSGDVERKLGAKRSVAGTWTMDGQIARAVNVLRATAGIMGALAGAIARRLNWPTPDKTLDAYRIDLHTIQVSYTDRANIKNTMSARYAKEWSGHRNEIEADRAVVTADDSDSVTLYETLQDNQAEFPYIISEALAQRVINGKLVDLAYPRLIVSLQGGSYLFDIERGDVIAFSFEDDDVLDEALLKLVATTDRFRVFDMNKISDVAYELHIVRL